MNCSDKENEIPQDSHQLVDEKNIKSKEVVISEEGSIKREQMINPDEEKKINHSENIDQVVQTTETGVQTTQENLQNSEPPLEHIEDQNNNEQNEQNPSQSEAPVQNVIDTISNVHLMSEESIEALREILCTKNNIFYEFSMKDENIEEAFRLILKAKAKIAEGSIGEALNYYHQRLLDSELGHLDQLIKILKSKKRDMFLRKCVPETRSENSESEQPKESEKEVEDPEKIREILNDMTTESAFEMLERHNSNTFRRMLPDYSQQHKFIRFQLNDSYEVYLKNCEEKAPVKRSKIQELPNEILQNHLLIYFNSMDLFKLRGVCCEWRELIRGMWNMIFKREMMEQVIAADLCNDIEMNFKLMNIKSPFYQKFGIMMKALTEIIEWEPFLEKFSDENLDYRIKYIVLTFLKLTGMDVGFEKLSEYKEDAWQIVKEGAKIIIPKLVESIFTQGFHFNSNSYIDEVKLNFLDTPDILAQNIRSLGDKNATMFQLFVRQLSVFAQLKNFLSLAQFYVIFAKDKLKEVSKQWPQRKGFLEGAYKILLFKYVQIKDGEVTIAKDDEDGPKSGILKDIQYELTQCITLSRRQENQSNQELEDKIFRRSPNKPSSNQEASTLTDFNPSEQLGTDMQHSNCCENVEKLSQPVGEVGASEEKKENNPEIKEDNQEEGQVVDEGDKILDGLMDENLMKIIQMKQGKAGNPFENFLKGESADYVIAKNDSETRLFLDNSIKIEFLIQRFLKYHVLKTLRAQASKLEAAVKEKEQETKELAEQLRLEKEKMNREFNEDPSQ